MKHKFLLLLKAIGQRSSWKSLCPSRATLSEAEIPLRLLEMGEKAILPPRAYWGFQGDMEWPQRDSEARERSKGRKGREGEQKGEGAAGVVWEGSLVPHNSSPRPTHPHPVPLTQAVASTCEVGLHYLCSYQTKRPI